MQQMSSETAVSLFCGSQGLPKGTVPFQLIITRDLIMPEENSLKMCRLLLKKQKQNRTKGSQCIYRPDCHLVPLHLEQEGKTIIK